MKPSRSFSARLTAAAPFAAAAIAFALWEAAVRLTEVPAYLLPAPSLIAATLWRDAPDLFAGLAVTLGIALAALVLAVAGGLAVALAVSQSRALERLAYPFLVTLQVTPIVAIAPLIIVWVGDPLTAVLLCASIVAFFPIVANTTLGLASADPGALELFRLYRASRWQTLWRLRWPTALPYFFGGLRVAGGLALIGAVVAEFVAGTGGEASGLAYRILEAGYRLQTPRMFAALLLLALAGIAIHAVLDRLSRRVLRHWHASALRGDD